MRTLNARGYRLACLGLALSISAHSGAWGRLGHYVASDIAELYLTDAARQHIRELIGEESLAEASVWADEMRSDPAPYWQDRAGAYHYVTVPPGRRYRDIGAPSQGDAVTALRDFGRILTNTTSSPQQRRLALRFGLHIVQDLQQPLHAGNGRDRGGNDIRVRFRGETMTFHRFWDSTVLTSTGLKRSQWVSDLERRSLLRAPTTADTDPERWIAESAALRETLYPVPRDIDGATLTSAQAAARTRLAAAGIRSAAWLNQVLEAPPPAGGDAAPVSWWRQLLGLDAKD